MLSQISRKDLYKYKTLNITNDNTDPTNDSINDINLNPAITLLYEVYRGLNSSNGENLEFIL